MLSVFLYPLCVLRNKQDPQIIHRGPIHIYIYTFIYIYTHTYTDKHDTHTHNGKLQVDSCHAAVSGREPLSKLSLSGNIVLRSQVRGSYSYDWGQCDTFTDHRLSIPGQRAALSDTPVPHIHQEHPTGRGNGLSHTRSGSRSPCAHQECPKPRSNSKLSAIKPFESNPGIADQAASAFNRACCVHVCQPRLPTSFNFGATIVIKMELRTTSGYDQSKITMQPRNPTRCQGSCCQLAKFQCQC